MKPLITLYWCFVILHNCFIHAQYTNLQFKDQQSYSPHPYPFVQPSYKYSYPEDQTSNEVAAYATESEFNNRYGTNQHSNYYDYQQTVRKASQYNQNQPQQYNYNNYNQYWQQQHPAESHSNDQRSRSDTSLSNTVGYDYYSGDYDYYGGEYLPPTEFETKMTKFVRYVAKGVYSIMTGVWKTVTERQDATIGEGDFAFNPLALISDPSSAIIPADNFIGFQLAPGAILPIAALAFILLFREPITDIVSDIIDPTTTTTTTTTTTRAPAPAPADPCASVTCVGGFTCSNGACVCGGVACDSTANVCNAGTCECGSTGGTCDANTRIPACLDATGMTAAGDDTAATCQCSGRLTAADTCAITTATDYAATEPLCGTDGTCGACQANADGTGGGGSGTGLTDGTMGTCQMTATFCCTDGSCNVSGSCP